MFSCHKPLSASFLGSWHALFILHSDGNAMVPLLPAPPRSLPGLPHMCRWNPQEDFAMSSFSDSHTFFFVCLSQLSSYVILFSDICLIILYKTRQGFFHSTSKILFLFQLHASILQHRAQGQALCEMTSAVPVPVHNPQYSMNKKTSCPVE